MCVDNLVVLAQLVEHRVVVARVAGSSPVHHPFPERSEIGRQAALFREPPCKYLVRPLDSRILPGVGHSAPGAYRLL